MDGKCFPKYLKLGKRILYPLTAVEEYENLLTVDVGFASTPVQNHRAGLGSIYAATRSIERKLAVVNYPLASHAAESMPCIVTTSNPVMTVVPTRACFSVRGSK
jgi:hypothetical protein